MGGGGGCRKVTEGVDAQVRRRVARNRGGKKTWSTCKKWGGGGVGLGGRC